MAPSGGLKLQPTFSSASVIAVAIFAIRKFLKNDKISFCHSLKSLVFEDVPVVPLQNLPETQRDK